MTSNTPSLTELAQTISEASAILQGLLEQQDLPQPSFGPDGLQAYPHQPEFLAVKVRLTDAIEDLQQLTNLPQERFAGQIVADIHDFTALKVYTQYNLWDAVPLDKSVTPKEVAQKVGLPEETVARLVRHTAGTRMFAITEDGSQISHSARSAAFVHDPKLRAWVGHQLDESWNASTNFADALRYYKADTVEPDKTAASYTFWKEDASIKTLFEFFNRPEQKWRVARFGAAMECATANPAFDISCLRKMYDWAALDKFSFVDIGGSVGHISFMLASAYPKGTFIVQDLPEMAPSFAAAVPAELKDRVSFESHDFFTPQTNTVQGADVFFLKHVLHDWSDPYAAKIIQQIVPAMTKPGARLMLMEGVIAPRSKVPRAIHRTVTGLDLQMMTMCNAKERSAEQWEQLLHLAHPDLRLVAIHESAGSAFVLIEAALKAS